MIAIPTHARGRTRTGRSVDTAGSMPFGLGIRAAAVSEWAFVATAIVLRMNGLSPHQPETSVADCMGSADLLRAVRGT